MILQYMCNGFIRDGSTETTIPDDDGTSDMNWQYGRHESYSWYQSCKARSRNRGLFISDRDLQGWGAVFTRQNNNGNRHGYECPEERDYYPYWHPSPWKDIAILTNNPAKCPAYQTESQNVKGRYYCAVDPDWQTSMIDRNQFGFVPITQIECEALDPPGVWTYIPPWNIPAPTCQNNTWTRDNHLGTPWFAFDNTMNSTTTSNYDWLLPTETSDPLIFAQDPLTGELASEHCVFRIRYNMSEKVFEDTTGSWPGATTNTGGFGAADTVTGSLADWHQNSIDPDHVVPSRLDTWSRYRISQSEVQDNFIPVQNQRTTAQRLTQLAAYTNSRGYVFEGNDENIWVNIFGNMLAARIYHQLAVDTSQFGRTFQDRSHMFSIRARPAALQGATIHNFGVRGKRGNNQQTYPATEYEFTPERFRVTKGDMVHFQWMGCNTNNQGNAGQGTAGTDRSNVILMGQQFQNNNQNLYSTDENSQQTVGQFQTNYPSRIDARSDAVNAPFLGFGYDDLRRLAKEGIYNPYFDLGPRQVTRTGTFHYMSTRNNNFSNRGQKGLIVVDNTADGTFQQVAWGSQYNKRVTDSGDSWLLDDDYKFPISADVYLVGWGHDSYYDSEWAQLNPIRFSTTPGSYQLMAMKYTYYPFMQPHVYWATNTEAQFVTEVPVKNQYYGVVEFSVTQGGFYVVKNQPDPGMIAGVIIGCLILCGGGGFAFYKYRRGWNKKPTSTTGADVPLNTSRHGGTSETTTGVEI